MRNISITRRGVLGACRYSALPSAPAAFLSGPGGARWRRGLAPPTGLYRRAQRDSHGDAVDAFNEGDQGSVEVTFFQNDA